VLAYIFQLVVSTINGEGLSSITLIGKIRRGATRSSTSPSNSITSSYKFCAYTAGWLGRRLPPSAGGRLKYFASSDFDSQSTRYNILEYFATIRLYFRRRGGVDAVYDVGNDDLGSDGVSSTPSDLARSLCCLGSALSTDNLNVGCLGVAQDIEDVEAS